MTVLIPTPLQSLTSGQTEVSATGNTLKDLIEDLNTRFPGIKERVLDESGKVRRFVAIFVNGEDIRGLEDLNTPLKESDEVSIVPAVAGG